MIILFISAKKPWEAVKKVANESRYQLADVKEKMMREMNNLRILLQTKTEENVILHSAKFQEIDKARKDAYEKSESRFHVAFKKQEIKHTEDKRKLEDRIRKEASETQLGAAR